MENAIEIKLFEVNNASVKKTAENAESTLKDVLHSVNDFQRHRVIKLYKDGTYYTHDTTLRHLFENIAYNAVYRNDAALIVDGIVVFKGSFELPMLRVMVKKLMFSHMNELKISA